MARHRNTGAARPAPKGALENGGHGRHRLADRQPVLRTKRVAATVGTGMLAAAIGAASLLVSDHGGTTRASATLPTAKVTSTAGPHTVDSTSSTSAVPGTTTTPTGDLIWQEKATPQPSSTYSTTATPVSSASTATPVQAEASDDSQDAPDTQGRPRFAKPAEGAFTSGFGARSGAFHYGIDIANRIGTPERAVANGVVVQAGPASGFGLWVRLRHDDGTVTVYGHMDRILVRQGQRVAAGQQIATMGARGQATGPHLHFEVWVGGSARNKINPVPWLAARGISL